MKLPGFLNRETMLVGLMLLLIAVNSALFPAIFPTVGNLTAILRSLAFDGIMVCGMMLLLVSGTFDLSVGGTFSMAGVVAGWMMKNGELPVAVSIAIALVVAMTAGLVNGLIVARVRVNALIATLGTMGIYRGLTTWLSQGGAITLRNPEIQTLYRPVYFGNVIGVPVPVIVIFVTAAIAAFVLYRTRYGRHLTAVGSSEDVARYSGISVVRVRTIAYVVQGLCVAVAVLLYVPRLASTSATTGMLWELQAITAVVVGGTALRGGVGRIWGTICGAFILEIVGNIMILSNFVSEYLIGAIQGAIIIIAMLVQRSLSRR